MTGKSVEKLLRKLNARKYRWQMQKFVAEGEKVIEDIIRAGLAADMIVASVPHQLPATQLLSHSPAQLKKWSSLESGGQMIAVFPFPRFDDSSIHSQVLVLDQISDPGNLGTIIRCAEWFGIGRIYCVKGSVDAFNAKTVQSTMGSIGRVEIIYGEAEEIFEKVQGRQLWCAHLEGRDVFQLTAQPGDSAIIMGSESHGPSQFWLSRAEAISIPRHPSSHTESLNVATATAIILSQLRHFS